MLWGCRFAVARCGLTSPLTMPAASSQAPLPVSLACVSQHAQPKADASHCTLHNAPAVVHAHNCRGGVVGCVGACMVPHAQPAAPHLQAKSTWPCTPQPTAPLCMQTEKQPRHNCSRLQEAATPAARRGWDHTGDPPCAPLHQQRPSRMPAEASMVWAGNAPSC
jgi:hypothetical protein